MRGCRVYYDSILVSITHQDGEIDEVTTGSLIAISNPTDWLRGLHEPVTPQVPRIYFDGGPRDGSYEELDIEKTIVQVTSYKLVGEADSLLIYEYEG